MKNLLGFIFFVICAIFPAFSQNVDTVFFPEIKYNYPKTYEVAGIEVSGIKNVDENAIHNYRNML